MMHHRNRRVKVHSSPINLWIMIIALVLSGLWSCSDDIASQHFPDAKVDSTIILDKAVPDSSVGLMFLMGSPKDEPCRYPNEDQHQVLLTHPFEVMPKEVTLKEFQNLMGYAPTDSKACGDDCPISDISWFQAVAYCNALSKKNNLTECYTCTGSGYQVSCEEKADYQQAKIYSCPGYRLPTEAEWEYAYRAGTQTAFYNGPIQASNCENSDPNADAIAWYGPNANNQAHPVGQKTPNALGLYDMPGNVGEWCNDWYQESLGTGAVTDPWGPPSGTDKVVRGGTWFSLVKARHVRAAMRMEHYPPNNTYLNIGFRCAKTK